MREIDTDALAAVLPSLGIGNPGTATRSADFDDEVLQQTLDVNPLVRRARAIVPSEGIFLGNMLNQHAIAGQKVCDLDPYTPAAGIAQSPYPSPLPSGFDVWIIGVGGFASTDSVLVASLQLVYGASETAFTVPGPTPLGCSPIYALWNDSVSKGAGTRALTTTTDVSKVFQGAPLRLRKGVIVRWRSEASAACDISANIVFAVLPSGLGQDVAF